MGQCHLSYSLGLLGLRASRLPWARARQQVLRERASASLRGGLAWALGESLAQAWPSGPAALGAAACTLDLPVSSRPQSGSLGVLLEVVRF